MNFKQVDDLASVWCQCGELELRHENYDEALKLLRVRMKTAQECVMGLRLAPQCLCHCLSTESDSFASPPGRVL